MKRIIHVIVITGILLGYQALSYGEARVLYDFEKGVEGWEIPDWAYEQDDYVGETLDSSSDFASKGNSSLKLTANFPGRTWKGAIAEVMEYMDWTPYNRISCDIMVPKQAPAGLKAKIVLTVGDDWKWTEMSRSIKLKPGEWVTISANLLPGSMDWKRTNPTDEFRADIRKIDLRVESNRKPVYNGPIYIDNIRVD